MKMIKNIFDKLDPHFQKGGKLEKMYPAYDAFRTMAFVPSHTSISGSHIRDSVDLKRTMFTVILALVPCLIFGMWNIGYQHYQNIIDLNTETIQNISFIEAFNFGFWEMLPMIIVSYAVGLGLEFAFAIYRGHQVNEGYLVTGLLIPMIMPITTPLWMLAISVIFAVVIGKEVFGGTGMNILNPALTARAFLFFAYPANMSGDSVWINTVIEGKERIVNGFSGATPLADLASNRIAYYTDSLGVSLVKYTEKGKNISDEVIQYTYSIGDMFMGYIPGSVSETSFVAIMIGAMILLISGVGSWRTILSVFIGGFFMAFLFNLWGMNELMRFPAHLHLILGGFAFGAVFMATDPVTASQTNKGKIIVGFLIGALAIMIRVFNPAFPEGMMMAILFMNVFAPLVDHYVIQSNIKKRLKRLKS